MVELRTSESPLKQNLASAGGPNALENIFHLIAMGLDV